MALTVELPQLFMEKVRQLDKLIGWQLKSETVCCGVTLSQCQIILELGKLGKTSMVDLASLLGIDNSTLSRNINGMVKLDLVNRESNSADRRYVTLSLTEQGQKVFRSIEQMCSHFYQEVCQLIPLHKQQQVLESFDILVAAIIKVRETASLPECCAAAKSSEKRGKIND